MATASAPQGSAPPEKKQTPSAMRSVLAGSTAGAVEIGRLNLRHYLGNRLVD